MTSNKNIDWFDNEDKLYMRSAHIDLITKLEHEESLSTNINYSSNNSIRATN